MPKRKKLTEKIVRKAADGDVYYVTPFAYSLCWIFWGSAAVPYLAALMLRCGKEQGELSRDIVDCYSILGGHDAQKTKATSIDALSLVLRGADADSQCLWSAYNYQHVGYDHPGQGWYLG
jgi:hypothetical protein